ncbi:RagB/SusD family nutrient uptake outer membrane protein [Gaoshiqia sediminis]|uniref:RagB/SusD family nutrient uptake outer membrane protein n=1 Tax=Gaoshiqia sediminis TaxID=2986998 RepID=A0AA41YAT0_9BACT|nr:RagB/SusD family nutrient uptake outer membrane protein [Gaoshiqia sediminis]MCW0484886.1 RagB/SusD family nutrient uptake outer membrane protein [Gaoshiqia sediminis]
MKAIKRILPIVILILFSVSCEKKILDISPQDRIAEDAVWNDAKLIQAYHSELYNSEVHGFYIHMYSKYTDEAYNSAPCCGANLLKLNTYNPDNITQAGGDAAGFWASGSGYLYYWDRGYEYIRKINVFLEKIKEITVDLPDKDILVAEAKFLRAFIYFNLVERFGGVPIVKESYELDAADQVQFMRSSFDDCVNFIADDLNEAMPDLPDQYQSTDTNYGRATGDACKALLSRLYLYAASPLFNPSHDMSKWQMAADAAEALLNSGYSLYPDYQKLFELSQGDAQDEVIFSRGFTSSNGHNVGPDNLNRRFEANGGWWGSNGPTGNLVDAYDMINGEPPFLADGSVNPASGYDPKNPWDNRDPRLEATIIHDGSVFRPDLTPGHPTFEMWIAEDGSSWGYDSYKNTGDNPRTNTVLKKFMPEEGPINRQTPATNQWPFFRLAEIYLNYAEAKFELGDETTAREYVNKVRQRASVNLPDIPESVTGEDLKRRIYNERRIELAFESHRFFDVRRWKIANQVENTKIYTYDIYKNLTTGAKRYEKVVLLDKSETFKDHQSLLPIAQDEILRTGLTQTDGY